MPEESSPVAIAEATALFAGLEGASGLLLAVSGGPDSVALLLLAARWRDRSKIKPKLFAATVDHGLRPAARREALMVARLARQFGVPHRILRWRGTKPKSGLQQAARNARYGLLAAAAQKAGASHIVTAHTLDDQAETVIMRMARGSGLAGLAAMARMSVRGGLRLARPLLGIPKSRLVATLTKAKIPFAEDPSNRNPDFTRVRIRNAMPVLAEEGLTAARLARLAQRLGRADEALEVVAARAMAALARQAPGPGSIAFAADEFNRLPAEIGLRLLRHAIDATGDEGPVELGKLETLFEAAMAARKAPKSRFRRSLAGAIVTVANGRLTVERAPPRVRKSLTKAKTPRAPRPKAR